MPVRLLPVQHPQPKCPERHSSPSTTRKNVHCKNVQQHSNLLASMGDACTSLPSQPSPCCCNQSLMGENATLQQLACFPHGKFSQQQDDQAHKVKVTQKSKEGALCSSEITQRTTCAAVEDSGPLPALLSGTRPSSTVRIRPRASPTRKVCDTTRFN